MRILSTISNRLSGGGFAIEVVPERTTIRHAIAYTVEVGTRADIHDAQTHPFTNWGYRDSLDHTLRKGTR